MTTRCRYVAHDHPRMVCTTDHERGEVCAECEVCRGPHCRVCNLTHVEHTCPGCLADTRETLAAIVVLCGALPTEAIHRGVESEAEVLCGPVADPEARGHLEASVMAGRVSADYLANGGGETHPVWTALSWQMIYRDAFDHDDAPDSELTTAIAYLDANLTYASTWPHVPFEDMARDLARCRAHLEAVLHDGEQHDRGAPCMNCGAALERVWGTNLDHDGWECPRCHQSSTEAQYRFAVAHLHREEAEWLTDQDIEIRTGVKAGTVRVWATRDDVRRRTDAGRVLYAVVDVETQARERGMLAS